MNRMALVVPSAGGTREQLVPGSEQCPGAVHPDPVGAALGDQFANGVIGQQLSYFGRERRSDTIGQIGIAITQGCRCARDDVAITRGDEVEGPVQEAGPALDVIGKLRTSLTGGELLVHRVAPGGERITPCVDAVRPISDAGRTEDGVEGIWFCCRDHPDVEGAAAGGTFHVQSGRHRVMAFAPDCCGDWKSLSDNRFRGKLSG